MKVNSNVDKWLTVIDGTTLEYLMGNVVYMVDECEWGDFAIHTTKSSPPKYCFKSGRFTGAVDLSGYLDYLPLLSVGEDILLTERVSVEIFEEFSRIINL